MGAITDRDCRARVRRIVLFFSGRGRAIGKPSASYGMEKYYATAELISATIWKLSGGENIYGHFAKLAPRERFQRALCTTGIRHNAYRTRPSVGATTRCDDIDKKRIYADERAVDAFGRSLRSRKDNEAYRATSRKNDYFSRGRKINCPVYKSSRIIYENL